MHESFLRFLRGGIDSWMLRLEMRLIPAVTALNVDGFDILVKTMWLKLKLSHVTFIVSLVIIWPINQHYIGKNQSMTLHLSALDSCSGVSDQQRVGSSPGHANCVLQWDTFTIIALSFGWDIRLYIPYTCIGSARKKAQNTYRGRVGVNPGVSGSHSKHPCL